MFNDMTFDELNRLNDTQKAVDYEEFFGGMDISEDSRDERIDMANRLEEAFLFVMALMFTMQQYESVDWNQAEEEFRNAYTQVLVDDGNYDDYMEQHVQQFSQEVTESTRRNQIDPYYYTSDRAKFMAENESNVAASHSEYANAVEAGMTQKQWIDIRDDRERETHLEVGRQIIPIDEPFQVGNSLMMYARDTQTYSAEPKEYINCRCTTRYF